MILIKRSQKIFFILIRWIRERKLSAAAAGVVLLYLARRLWNFLKSDAYLKPNWPQREYNEEAKKYFLGIFHPQYGCVDETVAKEKHVFRPLYGSGLPNFEASNWRKYLFSWKTPQENLREILGTTKKADYPFEKVTVQDLVVCMQYILRIRFIDELLAGNFFTENQLKDIACDLLKESNVKIIDKPEGPTIYDIKEIPFEMPYRDISINMMWLGACIGRHLSRIVLGLRARKVEVVGETGIVSQLVYFERPGKGTTQFLIHGGLTAGICWNPCIPFLKGRLIIIDLSDLANSFTRSTPKTNSILDQVRMIEAFVQIPDMFAPDERVSVTGHSLGACITFHLATRNRCPMFTRFTIIAPVLSTLTYMWGNNPMAVCDHNTHPELPDAIDHILQRTVAAHFISPEFSNIVFGSGWYDFHGSGINPETGRPIVLSKPMLLIWGTEDDICIPRIEQNLYETFQLTFPNPYSQAIWIKGSRHTIIVDSFYTIAKCFNTWSAPEEPGDVSQINGVLSMSEHWRQNFRDGCKQRVLSKTRSAGFLHKSKTLTLREAISKQNSTIPNPVDNLRTSGAFYNMEKLNNVQGNTDNFKRIRSLLNFENHIVNIQNVDMDEPEIGSLTLPERVDKENRVGVTKGNLVNVK